MCRNDIDNKYLFLIGKLEEEFFDYTDDGHGTLIRNIKNDKNILEFNELHGNIWNEHELELIEKGFIIKDIFEEKLNKIRKIRNSLLSECDFTQLPDAPISDELKLAYREYRIQLRDLPNIITIDNIDDVEFPICPE